MKKRVYLSSLAGAPLIKYLKEHGLQPVLLTGKMSDGTVSPVYKDISTHADIHMCRLGLWENSKLFSGNTAYLTSDYPGNIIYNAVCTGKYFIHNLKFTHKDLLAAADQWSLENYPGTTLIKIHVSQGYTRCCCLPVDDSSFITSDEGIAKTMKNSKTDVLLIQKGHILLPGFKYGFIGGCCGHMILQDKKSLIFNGNLKAHPDFKKITAFAKDRNINIVYFENYPLTDIGSILQE